MDGTIRIRRVVSPEDWHAWDDYLAQQTAATYAETAAWRDVLVSRYGFENWHLLAERDGRVVGCLGLFLMRSVLNGRHAVSAPLSSSGGGFHADDEEAACALLEDAERMVEEKKLAYCHLRMTAPVDATPDRGWVPVDRYVRFIVDISGGEDDVWNNVFRDKMRNQVRKAGKFDFRIAKGHEVLGDAARVLHRGLKELGSPSPGRGLFEGALRRFGSDMDFIVIYDGDIPVSGTVLFFYRGSAANPWASTLRAYRESCVNNLLYWEIVRSACERGCVELDLGRSLIDSGTYHFKRRLGGVSHPLPYYYYLNTRPRIPVIDPINKRFGLPQTLWRLTPEVLTRSITDRVLKELV